MSAAAEGYVWEHSPYDGATFVVHLAIADVVNDVHRFRFWMPAEELARKARVSYKTVQRAIDQLTRDGYLRLVAKAAFHRPPEYMFLTPRVDMVTTLPENRVDMVSERVDILSNRVDMVTTPIGTQENSRQLKAARTSRRKAQTPFPETFVLRDPDREWAALRAPHVDVQLETQSFASWWRADGRLKADWYQAWRNWMTKAEMRSASTPVRRFA